MASGGPVMTGLHDAVSDYLTIRRALGFKLVEHQRLLPDFASFVEQAGADAITTTLAVDWAIRTSGNDSWKAARLSIVRGFARYLRTINPRTEIPPEGLLCGQPQYAIPYLYSEQEIARLLAAAARMRPPLRAATFTTIIGLLAVTGMRIGEALALDRDDVDLDAGVLTIRDTKFGKSRQLPLHPTSTAALADYALVRDELCPHATSASFFVSTHASRPDKSTIQAGFRALRNAAGIQARPGAGAARLHDFRHSFAVRTLLDWHRTGVDVQARMLWLATYMGHSKPASSYWYLTAAPELLALAATRLETTLEDLA
jgi:integrase/recombinase XerD